MDDFIVLVLGIWLVCLIKVLNDEFKEKDNDDKQQNEE